MGLRAFGVTIRAEDGRTRVRLPRAYGGTPETVRDPAVLLSALARKTNAWSESTIRDDFPDELRHAIDRIDAHARRNAFRVIRKASEYSGFRAAVEAGGCLVEHGHELDEASVAAMARRIASGEVPQEVPAPDLTAYDAFMRTNERKEA